MANNLIKDLFKQAMWIFQFNPHFRIYNNMPSKMWDKLLIHFHTTIAQQLKLGDG